MSAKRLRIFGEWYLRIGLGTAFLSAVADRFGLWGPPGSKFAGWGDWAHFLQYCAQVNSFLPTAIVPALAWIATVAEIVFGVALIAGYRLRDAAYGSAVLLTFFGLAMTITLGVKRPLGYSVFADAGAAFFLGAMLTGDSKNGRTAR